MLKSSGDMLVLTMFFFATAVNLRRIHRLVTMEVGIINAFQIPQNTCLWKDKSLLRVIPILLFVISFLILDFNTSFARLLLDNHPVIIVI